MLPEQGRFDELSFPRLLLDLQRAGFGGWVRVSRGRAEKAFLIDDGVPIFAESNLGSDSLGHQLLLAGTISRTDRALVADHAKRNGCPEGKALLELEILDARSLFDAVKQQVRSRLLECFAWEDGEFHIEPGHGAPDATQAFRTDLYRLLQEGIETHWSRERVLADLEPRLQRFPSRTRRTRQLLARLQSDDSLDAVLAALDGTRTLWQGLQCAATPRVLATLWLLDALDALDFSDSSRLAAAEAEAEAREIEIVVRDERNHAPSTPASGRRERVGSRREAVLAARLQQQVAAKCETLAASTHYELLGVDARADSPEIKRAYLAAAKEYHPDALARLGIVGEARVQAGKVFAAIGRAYAVLTNPKQRREYDARLSGADLGADADQIATAETLYRKGEVLLRQGNFRGALEFLRPAVEIYPEEADYQNALGWALYKQMPSDPKAARTHLVHAVELAPKDAVLLFRLSVVLRRLGEEGEANALLERSKQLRPAAH